VNDRSLKEKQYGISKIIQRNGKGKRSADTHTYITLAINGDI